ncbi:cytotoxin [Candidatus Roizmanbacteria bacterium CG_4_9_14_0_2_um_filter_39_13]|uniref:Cytotoxin n=2 Tax=Candidatus Roizmaniibacteriota TaxID=1752723 RepID=A0A2M8F4V2_9BACT|nr:MAG: cytotoxin [Candidatus Roizmanbacteria bacterium CG_4_10_14_0_2_um_filter_39_12]PJC34312.1 MAG: cytotoxin [Candidatus Roizmanbacteria bacterium CG_4_9_14_0_2_um_filter_39_13]PJE61865.1 MAG: cytotoxin [Candidatus Roizmanbacteria bacterium CG10_big_fil_rev_8_21_14_0_10_39_12]
MIQVATTPHFKRSRNKYIKNSVKKAKQFLSALNAFRHNPSHPSLNVEKLINSDIWSMRINRSDWIFFAWINNETALLLEIGHHDMYRKV